MGLNLFDVLGAVIDTLGSANTSPSQKTPASHSSQATAPKPVLVSKDIGSTLTGTVVKVAENYVLLAYGDTSVLIPKGELGRGRVWVERTSDIVQEGQSVDFVLTEQSERGWKGSLHAIDEATVRASLASLQQGDRIAASVATIKEKGVELSCRNFMIWVPLGEISWSWIEHPSESVKLGQQVEAEILRVSRPDNWLRDKRARNSRVTGSIRACIDQPQLSSRAMTFSATTFRVCVAARVPPQFDPVVLFILKALVEPLSPEAIATLTGLPLASVQEVLALLAEEELQKGGIVNKNGLHLLAAVNAAETFTTSNVRGLFASAAPDDRCVLPVGQLRPVRSPDWPKPVHSIGSLNRFLKKRDNALPEWLLSRIQVNDEQREQLGEMLSNRFLSVFLSREEGDRDVDIEVPERWLLAGLWTGFTPADEPPFRPGPKEFGCTTFLIARYGTGETALYWEPTTCTLWNSRSSTRVNIVNKACPDELMNDMPAGIALRLSQAGPGQWCYATIGGIPS